MIYNISSLILLSLLGVIAGYYITKALTKRRSEETVEYSIVERKKDYVKPKEPVKTFIGEPRDFNELVLSLRDRFMLSEVTLATFDGIPIASTGDNPEEISALAPEILKKVGGILKTNSVIVSGKDYRIGVFEINQDVIGCVKANRDIHFVEIEKIREEVNKFMEVRA